MNRFKISTRVATLSALLSLLLLTIGSLGLWGMGRSNEALRSMYADNLIATGEVTQIQALLLHNRLAIAIALITPEPATIEASSKQVEANIAAITRIWDAYLARSHGPEESRLARDFTEHRGRFVQEGLRPTVAALRSGDLPGATRLVTTAVRPLYVPVGANIEALVQLQADEGRKASAASAERYATVRAVAWATIAGGLLLAILFAATMVRGIRRALEQAVHSAERIAQGDLSQPIAVGGRDEAAQVLRALAAMQRQLTGVVATIREGGESVASASSQISTGNHDLANRTAQQASALEQTAAAMEQLNAAVQHNADNAGQARALAAEASTVAERGGAVMDQVVATMRDIHASSGRIADIIGVIDGIAFQTNILALNAAVEAARAGEQGRGFAVVASEVRSLAQRSAEAAKEIKQLISASTERVGQGASLVDAAGTTIQEAVAAIRRVTTLMADISAASTEQRGGTAQIGQAVQHLDQATQQNAALVEELSAAACSLQEQARAQVAAIAVFTLEAAAPHAPAPAVRLLSAAA
ncbi:methyl-accepting chemotaxis protein [Acidovorax radicis]|uniref:methyl-accepting chemotaxis protein n=1 Tax=Acidovorax radicis TaxID=758826 RepID=UPI001CF96DCC|nr:methyl-accepting chemotaxis protein [Acidovorax radicis]UCV00950.1 Tar ligand binding domain-containing protein [Acidovorax radicis]